MIGSTSPCCQRHAKKANEANKDMVSVVRAAIGTTRRKGYFAYLAYFATSPSFERHIPEYVSQAAWETAVEVGERFLGEWGDQAEALGWTEQNLFGLHRPPAKPAAGYSRLARYDATGLVWLLGGRRVCALTERSAAIDNRISGTVTHFRRGRT